MPKNPMNYRVTVSSCFDQKDEAERADFSTYRGAHVWMFDRAMELATLMGSGHFKGIIRRPTDETGSVMLSIQASTVDTRWKLQLLDLHDPVELD